MDWVDDKYIKRLVSGVDIFEFLFWGVYVCWKDEFFSWENCIVVRINDIYCD